jgi:hypothetical protein
MSLTPEQYEKNEENETPLNLCVGLTRTTTSPECMDSAYVYLEDEEGNRKTVATISSGSPTASRKVYLKSSGKYRLVFSKISGRGPVPIKICVVAGEGGTITGGESIIVVPAPNPETPDVKVSVLQAEAALGEKVIEIKTDCDCPEISIVSGTPPPPAP